jgi:hypothetical protein
MSKKTEFQNWSEINQVEGNRFQRFETLLKEGWQAHSLDCATFAEFADAARKEFEVKLSNLNSEFLKWQKTRPHHVSGMHTPYLTRAPARYRIWRVNAPREPSPLLTLVNPRPKPETPA